jgi:hypothetical protein
MTPEIKRRLAAIASRWNDIEERMKKLELLRGETLSAAVNELRYTGRKIADVLSIVTGDDQGQVTIDAANKELIVAENYLNNADHDITDAVVLFVGIRVKRVVERHGKKKIIGCFPEFEKLHAWLEKAHAVVAESRGQRGQRTEIYKDLAKTHVPLLLELHRGLASHPDLGLPEEGRKLQLISVMAIIGATAGVCTFLFNVFSWWFTPDYPTLAEIENGLRSVIQQTGPSSQAK